MISESKRTVRRGGASRSERLLAAMAVLAVAFVVLAAVPAALTDDDSQGDATGDTATVSSFEELKTANANEEIKTIKVQKYLQITENFETNKDVVLDSGNISIVGEGVHASFCNVTGGQYGPLSTTLDCRGGASLSVSGTVSKVQLQTVIGATGGDGCYASIWVWGTETGISDITLGTNGVVYGTLDAGASIYGTGFTIPENETLTIAAGKSVELELPVQGDIILMEAEQSKASVVISGNATYTGTISQATKTEGSVTIGSVAQVTNLKAAQKQELSITAGSIEISGAVVEQTGTSITIVSGEGKLAEDFTIPAGMTLTVASGASLEVSGDLTVSEGATLTVAGELTTDQGKTIKNSGTVQSVNGGNLNGATIENEGTSAKVVEIEDDSDMETVSIEGTIKGAQNQYDASQLVRIVGNTTMVENSVLTIYGKLYIPEEVTLTMEAGAQLVLDKNAVLEIDGTLLVKETDDENGDAVVKLASGSVFVNGIMNLKGDLVLTKGNVAVKADGIMSVDETGSFIVGEKAASVKVEGSGVMGVAGYLGAMTILDDGTVQFDSEVACGNVVIQLGNGGTVDIDSLTLKENGTLTVQDVDASKTVQNKIEIKATKTGTNGSDATSGAYCAAVIEGIEITEKTTTSSGSTTYMMYIDGDVEVSGIYVTTGSENEPSLDGTTASITLTGSTADKHGITVSEDLSIGKNVTLTNAGQLIVSADIDGTEGTIVQTSESITVEGEGSIVVKTEITNKTGINATMYSYKVGTTTYCNYVTLDAALAVAAAGNSSDLTVLGEQTLYASAGVPFGTKLIITDATITIGEKATSTDITLTVEDGASVKGTPTKVVINGTIYACDKTDVDSAARDKFSAGSSVYTEELNAKGQAVRDGWAKWTNITAALSEAEEDTVVKITQDLVIGVDTTIPARVTLDTNNHKVTVSKNVTLTVNGTLYIDKGATDNNLVLTKAPTETDKDAAIVLNGYILSDKTIDAKLADGKDIPGAYFSVTESGTTNYYVTTVALAAELIQTADGQTVTLKGAELTVGDMSFAGESSSSMATVSVEATKLTVTSVTLSNAKIVFTELTTGKTLKGTIKDANGSVVLDGKIGAFPTPNYSGTLTAESKDKFTLSGAFTAGTGGKFEVSGTAYTNALSVDSAKVAGTLNLAGINDIDVLDVSGTLSVQKSASLDTDEAAVSGTVSVASDAGTVSIGKLFVGITEDYAIKTGAAASVTGTIKLTDYALVAPGSTVPELSKSITTFYIENAVYLIGYAGTGCDLEIADIDGHITNARFDGWYNEDGDAASTEVIGAPDWSKATAKVERNIYEIVLKADEGIADVYVDGNLMSYGLYNDDGSLIYYAYVTTVAAGSHTISYTLKNGWSGTAVLSVDGSKQSAYTFSTSGTPASGEKTISYGLQLTGIEKSGYVDPAQPVEPKDDGLKVTDYLLIVLVILVVILAVIVAMRLMRS